MENYNWDEIGKRVKEIRKKELNMTQEELAESLSTSRYIIFNIETNRLSRPEQKKSLVEYFCQKYGISMDYIFDGIGDWRAIKENTFIQNAYDLTGDAFIESFIETYHGKAESEKEFLRNFIADLYNNMNKKRD